MYASGAPWKRGKQKETPPVKRGFHDPELGGTSTLGSHRGRLQTLRPALHLEVNLLAFLQSAKARTLDRGVVDKYIVTTLARRNEAETFRFIEPLYGTSCHANKLHGLKPQGVMQSIGGQRKETIRNFFTTCDTFMQSG